jgi:hypothetical protein
MSPLMQMPSFGSIMEVYQSKFYTEMHRSSSPCATCVDCTEEDEEEDKSIPDPQIHDSGPIDDSDDESLAKNPKPGTFLFSPKLQEVKKALQDITDTLKPP